MDVKEWLRKKIIKGRAIRHSVDEYESALNYINDLEERNSSGRKVRKQLSQTLRAAQCDITALQLQARNTAITLRDTAELLTEAEDLREAIDIAVSFLNIEQQIRVLRGETQ